MPASSSIGANVIPGGVEYRVWAYDCTRIAVAVGADDGRPDRLIPLARDADGMFAGSDPQGRAGDRYGFRIDEQPERAPDPASRFQPDGVFGPSEVIDPRAYRWGDAGWKRPSAKGRILYELHIGTFTPEGTFAAAVGKLDAIDELGANTIEIMPVGDFPGRWNWGYDGVMPYAPARCYGRPDDLRALVDAAHQHGLGVVLDVVYNHFGPVGNPLHRYSERYNHAEKESPWGRSFNFDGAQSGPVRAFFVGNAAYWLDEFHVDGLRLDATHAVHDESPRHLLADVAAVAASRGAFTIAEDERNEALIVSTESEGALGVNAVWADDFHHSVRVALTGDRRSYLAGYTGDAAELATILRQGWLYHGQIFPPTGKPRGTPGDRLPPERLVYCIDNHDQTGNRALGERLSALASPAGYRAAVVLLCLCPFTPMLFMGDEWAASTPFAFFTDLPGEVGVRMGEYRRKEFAAQGAEVVAKMPEPQAESTFRASQLDWTERTAGQHRKILALHREALALRAAHAHFQNPPRTLWAAAAAGGSVLLRWKAPERDWLLISSLKTRVAGPVEHGLAHPSAGRHWQPILGSEEPRFGGGTTAEPALDLPAVGGPASVLYRES